MPLDAAIRELGEELQGRNYFFAPVINPDGSYKIIPDQAHTLNGLPRSTSASGVVTNFGKPNYAFPGEEVLPGTKASFIDEYVIGYERELTPSLVFKARYTDRRIGRAIEDIGSQSPEGSTIGDNFVGGITNPTAKTDISVNEKAVTYTQAQFLAKNPSGNPKPGNYVPPVAGCTAANDTFFAVGGPFINGLNQEVGGSCFLNLATMDGPGPLPNGGDGIPDGFVQPVRRYQAAEFELDKRFSNHWLAKVNFRWGTLYGNYEGAYRNDNGQSDPGISSLFDFTTGQLGLLGDQFANGMLSTDRVRPRNQLAVRLHYWPTRPAGRPVRERHAQHGPSGCWQSLPELQHWLGYALFARCSWANARGGLARTVWRSAQPAGLSPNLSEPG
jgi:hypothetical protein